ncbi:MAG: PilZ domain-containing protein [Candidatus Acidiferrales bacterium]
MADRPEIRRRSKRLSLQVPVRVYGRAAGDQPFRVVTETLAVNAHGARVELSMLVTPGQSVLLVHGITEEEKECRVVYVQPSSRGKWKVGLEFVRPEGNFWHMFQPLRRVSGERKHHVE